MGLTHRGQHSSGQVRSGIHGCDADQAPPRGTAMDACIQSPLMIVGIDTIASDDDGHRGTVGGGGEKQGWIVGQGEYTVCKKLNVR